MSYATFRACSAEEFNYDVHHRLVARGLYFFVSARKDMVHGMGTLISEEGEKRRAIYWRDRRVCFIEGKDAYVCM